MNADKPLINAVLPELAKELKELLEKDNKFRLAESVELLRMYEECNCGENSCVSFYTEPKPTGSYGIGHESLMLEAHEGLLVLDVVNNEIKFVEILDRPEFKRQLSENLNSSK